MVIRTLRESRLPGAVDARVDALLTEWTDAGLPAFSHRAFHDAIAAFAQAVYAQALPVRQHLTREQAGGEAIALLEQAYQGAAGTGFCAAVVDASDPSRDGIAILLAELAGLLKARCRMRWTHAVVATRLGLLPWPIRCEVARLLLDRCAIHLPPSCSRLTPAQVVDEIPAMIDLLLAPERLVRTFSFPTA